jgi:hypothetical protein
MASQDSKDSKTIPNLERQLSTADIAQQIANNIKTTNDITCSSFLNCLEDVIIEELESLAHLNLSDIEKAAIKQEVTLIIRNSCGPIKRFCLSLFSSCRRKTAINTIASNNEEKKQS